MLRGARNAGLEIRNQPGARAFEIAPNALAPLVNSDERAWHDRGAVGAIKGWALTKAREGPDDRINASASTICRWRATADMVPETALYRPASLGKISLEPIEQKFDAVVHVATEGDTLSKLAKRYLGDPARYMEIFRINRDVIDDPEDLWPGVRLIIPGPSPALSEDDSQAASTTKMSPS